MLASPVTAWGAPDQHWKALLWGWHCGTASQVAAWDLASRGGVPVSELDAPVPLQHPTNTHGNVSKRQPRSLGSPGPAPGDSNVWEMTQRMEALSLSLSVSNISLLPSSRQMTPNYIQRQNRVFASHTVPPPRSLFVERLRVLCTVHSRKKKSGILRIRHIFFFLKVPDLTPTPFTFHNLSRSLPAQPGLF